jgi:hypothetical protein
LCTVCTSWNGKVKNKLFSTVYLIRLRLAGLADGPVAADEGVVAPDHGRLASKLFQLFVAEERLLRHGRQVVGRIEVAEREIDDLEKFVKNRRLLIKKSILNSFNKLTLPDIILKVT